MATAGIVLWVLLGVSFIGSGLAKIVGVGVMRADAERFGFPYGLYRMVGGLEVAGGAGLLIGLAFQPVGIAATVGLVALMIGALICPLRVGDGIEKAAGPVTFGIIVVAAGVLNVSA